MNPVSPIFSAAFVAPSPAFTIFELLKTKRRK
jgi:hypothetical protein